MTIRIPSSLKWLIKKYQHKQRELLETEKLLFELSIKHPKLIESIEPLSRVIDLHDIPIPASKLPYFRYKYQINRVALWQNHQIYL